MKAVKAILFLFLAAALTAIEPDPRALELFAEKEFINENGDTLLYRLLQPEKVKAGHRYPLVLFLHGSGERGRDNARQLIWGAGTFIDKKNRRCYPAYVVAPQCPKANAG